MGKISEILWSQYCKTHHTDTLYFFDPKQRLLVTIAEGTGENLDECDYEAGYVDYWNSEVYSYENGNVGGGILMVSTLIVNNDQKISDLLCLFEDNKELLLDMDGDIDLKQTMLPPEEGEALCELYEQRATALISERFKAS